MNQIIINPYAVTPAAPSFPLPNTELYGWWKDAGLTAQNLADDAFVPQWNDSSGNKRTLTAAFINRGFQYRSDAFGTIPGLKSTKWNGVYNFLSYLNPTFLDGSFCHIVFRAIDEDPTADGGTNYILACAAGYNTGNHAGSGRFAYFTDGQLTFSNIGSAILNTHIFTLISTPANAGAYVNGSTIHYYSAPADYQYSDTPELVFLHNFKGYVAEIMLFSSYNQTDCDNSFNYLAAKFGLTTSPISFGD